MSATYLESDARRVVPSAIVAHRTVHQVLCLLVARPPYANMNSGGYGIAEFHNAGHVFTYVTVRNLSCAKLLANYASPQLEEI
jgi:hypothetical protein